MMRWIRYYKRAYQELFMQTDTSNGHDSTISSCEKGYISDYHRFGWLLFLALRIHAFGRFKDLVTCTNGLVSILVSLWNIYFKLLIIETFSSLPKLLITVFFPCRLYLFSMRPSISGNLVFKTHQFLVIISCTFFCFQYCESIICILFLIFVVIANMAFHFQLNGQIRELTF